LQSEKVQSFEDPYSMKGSGTPLANFLYYRFPLCLVGRTTDGH